MDKFYGSRVDLENLELERTVDNPRDFSLLAMMKLDDPHKFVRQDTNITRLGNWHSRINLKHRRNTTHLPRIPTKEKLEKKVSLKNINNYIGTDFWNMVRIPNTMTGPFSFNEVDPDYIQKLTHPTRSPLKTKPHKPTYLGENNSHLSGPGFQGTLLYKKLTPLKFE